MTACIFGTNGTKIPARLYVTERPAPGRSIFTVEFAPAAHLAFRRKYLFYGRWHDSLTLAAARHRCTDHRKLHSRVDKKFICRARSNNKHALYNETRILLYKFLDITSYVSRTLISKLDYITPTFSHKIILYSNLNIVRTTNNAKYSSIKYFSSR